jgi:hypothetical protein
VKTAARSRGLSVSGYLADAARAELARDALAEIVSEAETHQGHAISTQDLEHANEEIEAELGGSDNEAAA